MHSNICILNKCSIFMINLSVRSDFGIQVQNRQTSNIASEITGKRKIRVKCSVNHSVTIFVLQT